MAAAQVPWGLAAVQAEVREAAWKVKPTAYLVTTQDRMIPPSVQRMMAKRSGARTIESGQQPRRDVVAPARGRRLHRDGGWRHQPRIPERIGHPNRGEQAVTQHVLFIVTNAAVIGPHNRKTGFFFAEVAHPFEVLDKAGIAVEFASPPADGRRTTRMTRKTRPRRHFSRARLFAG